MTTAPSAPADRPIVRRAWRSFAGGFALSAAVIAGSMQLSAATSGHNSNAPVAVDADHMELQDKQKRVVFSGNVDVKQDGLRLTADRTLLAYTDADKLLLQRIDATGHVVVTQRDERAAGDVAVYDTIRKVITMVGHVALKRGNGDNLNGGRLVIDLDTGISSIDGHSGSAAGSGVAGDPVGGRSGRVSGTFNVPKKN